MMVDTQVATGVDCKSMVSDFAGSSPARPTIYMLGWRTRSAQWSEKPPTMVQLHLQAPLYTSFSTVLRVRLISVYTKFDSLGVYQFIRGVLILEGLGHDSKSCDNAFDSYLWCHMPVCPSS